MDENSNLLANGGNTTDEGTDKEVNTETVEDAKRLELYLERSGFGLFHVVLILVVGLATAADAVEIFGVSFVVPIADEDLDLSSADKGWLDASIFIGMMIGGYTWGTLADAFGRKYTLMTAMLINGVCGLVSAFSPDFFFFLFFRLLSGIGVGGSQPIVFSYVSEFFTEKQRGPVIIILAACWQPGIIYAALLAWALMGVESHHNLIDVYIGRLHFVNWRLFLILCTIPALISSFSLLFLPESPAYLFLFKRYHALKKVLGTVRKVNELVPFCWFRNDEHDNTPLLLDSDTLEPSSPPPNLSPDHTHKLSKKQRCGSFLLTKARKIQQSTVGMFRLNYLRASILLLIVWFTQSYGYYGLQLWFPEYFKRIQMDCSPEEVVGSGSAVPLYNCSDNETNLQFYQDSLYTALASLPGNIAGAILINIIGGRVQLAAAMILSTLSVFSIWRVPNERATVVAVSCVFSAITVTVFGSLDVVVMNIYDTSLRSTAFGIHSAVGRIGAIMGNITFGHLIDADISLPILLVASLLSVGAVASVFLPPIYRPENRPPLQRLVVYLRNKYCCWPRRSGSVDIVRYSAVHGEGEGEQKEHFSESESTFSIVKEKEDSVTDA